MSDMNFQNPILFADYSDPDVTRVGDMFFMTASSFNYTPGLPILRSRDLVNWTLTGYAVRELGQTFDYPRHSEGIWAPAIRYYNDTFYIYYGMPDEGLYVVRGRFQTTEGFRNHCVDPAQGAGSEDRGYEFDHGCDLHIPGFIPIIWERPICVLEGRGLIDPCPYIDEDGRFWLVHAYAKSRIGFKSVLGMVELDAQGIKAISPDHIIFNGNLVSLPSDGNPDSGERGPGLQASSDAGRAGDERAFNGMIHREDYVHRFAGSKAKEPDDNNAPAITIEGPKVYKRDGYIYILAPAGGVRYGWQLALRSKDIHGPYECRVVMRQGSSIVNGPHQGGLVSYNRSDWFIHFQDLGPYGRVCHLQPVVWNDRWPVIGEPAGKGTWGEPVSGGSVAEISQKRFSTYHDYQWLGNYSEEYFAVFNPDENVVSEDMSYLFGGNSPYLGNHGKYRLKLQALNSQGADPVLWKCPNVLTRKPDRREFEVTVAFKVNKLQTGDRIGITFMGGEYAFLECAKRKDGGLDIRYGTSESITGTKDKKENLRVIETSGAEETEFIVSMVCREAGNGESAKEFTSVEDCHPVASFKYMTGKALPDDVTVGTGDAAFRDIGEEFKPSDHTWVGARVGVYAVSKGVRGGYAVIDAYEWDDFGSKEPSP